MTQKYARVRETIEYRVAIFPGDRAEDAGDRIADFGPDVDDIRERTDDFGAEVIDHTIVVVGEEEVRS